TVRSQWLRTFTSRPNTDWVTFSPDGHTLATWGSSSGHVVILWDTSSGTQTRVLGDDATSVGEPAFSPDGHLLVTDVASPGSDDRGLRLWDAASGSELRRFPGYMDAVLGRTAKCWQPGTRIIPSACSMWSQATKCAGSRDTKDFYLPMWSSVPTVACWPVPTTTPSSPSGT